jgi:hypothetical protein
MIEQNLIEVDRLLNTRLLENSSDDFSERVILAAGNVEQKKSRSLSTLRFIPGRPKITLALLSFCIVAVGLSLALAYFSSFSLLEQEGIFFIADK